VRQRETSPDRVLIYWLELLLIIGRRQQGHFCAGATPRLVPR
jgi:hypothetical protein